MAGIQDIQNKVTFGDTQGLFELQNRSSNKISTSEGLEASGALPNSSFSDLLSQSIDKVNREQIQADSAIKELVAGRNKNIHETLLTVERADSSLKMMMQVRNKILDAYREIMKMQV